MGKGDKRSRRGKIWKGSYGNSRRKKKAIKPAFVPKPKAKPKKVASPAEIATPEIPFIENAEVMQPEVKVAKPKKVSVKKPKVEGEAKVVTKKEPKKKASSAPSEPKTEE